MPQCIHGFLPIIKRIQCGPRAVRREASYSDRFSLVNQVTLYALATGRNRRGEAKNRQGVRYLP